MPGVAMSRASRLRVYEQLLRGQQKKAASGEVRRRPENEPTAALTDPFCRSQSRVEGSAIDQISEQARVGSGRRTRALRSCGFSALNESLLQGLEEWGGLHLVAQRQSTDGVEDRLALAEAAGTQCMLPKGRIGVHRLQRHLAVCGSEKHLCSARGTRCGLVDIGQKHSDQFGFSLHEQRVWLSMNCT